MEFLDRFRLALKFAAVPSDFVLKYAVSILGLIEERLGHGLEFLSAADLRKIDPKKLPDVARALFAFWMTTYGLDEMQLKVSAHLLEAELRLLFPFLNGPSDPRI